MAPSTGVERVTIDGQEYRSVREGLASILAPFKDSYVRQEPSGRPKNNDEGEQAVFYNPIQQFNRDLSVLAILIYGEGAVRQKQEKFQHRRHEKQSRRASVAKKGASGAQTDLNGDAIQEQSSKKRKADETSSQTHATGWKRQRIDEEDGEGDDMEIVELGGKQHDQDGPLPKSNELAADKSSSLLKSDKMSTQEDLQTSPPKPTVGFTILDALSATGLRALRYAKEIPFATNVVANDLSSDAVKSINLNIKHNNLSGRVHSNVGDARAFMYSKLGTQKQPAINQYVHRFDVIDLDPYGTAAPFLDSALQALQDGGLLCVTCTDAGVFASNGWPEKTYALYGGLPVKGAFSHEGGLRLILHAVAASAAKYGIAIEPLLSLSIDFYARIFIRIHRQQRDVKLLAGTSMIVYSCDQGCGSWSTQLLAKNQAKEDKKGDLIFKHGFAQAPNASPHCEHCGFKTHLGGPMWAGPLHNPYFVQRILDRLPKLDKSTYQTTDRLRGMLTLALEEDLTMSSTNATPTTPAPTVTTEQHQPHNNIISESQDSLTMTDDARVIPRLPADAIDASPFFFIPNCLAKVLHCQTPSEDQLRGAIRHLGYRVTRSHCKPGSFRTTAPWSVIWEIMREWVRTKAPIKDDAVKRGTPGWTILALQRGSERKLVAERRDALTLGLGKCESVEDMCTLLQAEMWRLDHPERKTSLTTTNNEVATSARTNGENDPGNDNKHSPPPPLGVSEATTATSDLRIIFDEVLGKEKPRGKLVRYQINPRANWGPMNRAAGNA